MSAPFWMMFDPRFFQRLHGKGIAHVAAVAAETASGQLVGALRGGQARHITWQFPTPKRHWGDIMGSCRDMYMICVIYIYVYICI